jgi:DNA-binding MarR family transcriptional regulator
VRRPPANDVKANALALDGQVCFALYTASRAVVRAYGPLLEPLAVTYPQYLVMLVLWEDGGVSMKRIGERLALDSGTLTPLLRRLEAAGLVTRERDAEDERVVTVRLTPEGLALRAKAKGIPSKLACALGIDPSDPGAVADLEELRDRLRAITSRLLDDHVGSGA